MANLKRVAVISIVIIIIAIAGVLAYTYLMFGTLNVYVIDQPEQVRIYLTVNSVMIHQINGSWITISNKTITVLLSPNMTLLASSRIPVGQYNEIFLMIIKVLVVTPILNVTAKLPSNVFKIHITNGLKMEYGSNHSILIRFPHLEFGPGGVTVSPSITAEVIS